MAFHSYVSFKGKKQGQFKGESQKGSRKDQWCEVKWYELHSAVPVDSKSGQPKGTRTHFPMLITKERGAASPQLLQACWTSEVLEEVVLESVGRPDTGAGEVVVERITLSNVIISDIRRFSDLQASEHAEHDLDPLDTVSLVYQTIKVENLLASTSTTDDWTANNT
jgi:type VI secretion system secreted protein Hcp